jgi:hypothetical protein
LVSTHPYFRGGRRSRSIANLLRGTYRHRFFVHAAILSLVSASLDVIEQDDRAYLHVGNSPPLRPHYRALPEDGAPLPWPVVLGADVDAPGAPPVCDEGVFIA